MGCEGVPVLSKCRCMREAGDLQGGGLEEAERVLVLGYAGISQGDGGDS